MNVQNFLAVIKDNAKIIASAIAVIITALCALFMCSSCTASTRILRTEDSVIHREIESNGTLDYKPTQISVIRSTSRTYGRNIPLPLESFIWVFFMIPNIAKRDPELCADPKMLDLLLKQPDFVPYGVLYHCDTENFDIPSSSIYVSEVFTDPAEASSVYKESLQILSQAQNGLSVIEDNEDAPLSVSDNDI